MVNIEKPKPFGLISLNANGLGEKKKRNRLICWFNKFHDGEKKKKILQETHTTVKSEELWKKEWGNRSIIFSHGTSGSKGVAIIFPKHLEYTINDIKRSHDGRFVAIKVEIEQNQYCIVNCYAPNVGKLKDQIEWLSHIQTIIEINSDVNLIIGGDLNDCFIPRLDRYRAKPGAAETEYVKAWKTLCAEFNLADVWRVLNPEKRRYTWRQGSSAKNLRQSRLDYWLVSIPLMYDMNTVDIKASYRSDHSLIDIDFFKANIPKRGPSYWRFNASLLRDKNYINKIKNGIQIAVAKYADIEDNGLKWDLVKMEIRSSTICYSKEKAKLTRDGIKETIVMVGKLENELNNNPTDDIIKKYNDGKKYIEEYNNEKAKGILIRSKADWAECGKKIRNFF